MKRIISFVMFVMLMVTTPLFANDIYVTQSGASLTLDILQDGENNTIGNSQTSSASTGATTSLNIDQVGDSNVITYQINGATYTELFSMTKRRPTSRSMPIDEPDTPFNRSPLESCARSGATTRS